MTLSAVGEFERVNAFLAMFALDLSRLMLVAAVARVGGVSSRVAGRALNIALFAMRKGEGMLGKPRGRPGLGRVAGGAVGAEETPMYLRLGVAGLTLRRGTGEDLIAMAGRTFDDPVLPLQRPHATVIKVGHLAGSVVAVQTRPAKLSCVLDDEGWLRLGVAIAAGRFLPGNIRRRLVASCARQRLAGIVSCVAHEAEARPLVIEIRQRRCCHVEIAPPVVKMTGGAVGRPLDRAVQPVPALTLGGDVGVTILTTRGFDSAPGSVALGAIQLEIGVSEKPVQGRLPTGLGRPATGAGPNDSGQGSYTTQPE